MADMNGFADLNLYQFRIPFSQPITLKGITYSERVGVLLEHNGRWSEASPLPGFSLETVDDVLAALQDESRPSPALEFALSGLEEPLLRPLEIPLNRLLLGSGSDVISQAQSCNAADYRAVKLKVGQGSTVDDAELVKEVRQILPDTVSIRLDANQAWTLDEAVDFAKRLSGIEVEYIEEPLQDPERLEAFYSLTRTSYALDETLLQNRSLAAWPNASALICKPSLLGGRMVVERLAATGIPIVFSAAFESGIGIARIVQLAQEFSPDIPAGLDTLDWLSGDLLSESPVRRGGMLAFDAEPKIDPAVIGDFIIREEKGIKFDRRRKDDL